MLDSSFEMNALRKPHWGLLIAAVLAILAGLIIMPLAQVTAAPNSIATGFGLRMDLTVGNNNPALLNAAQITRADWIAQSVQWKDIEAEPGDYNWAKLDAALLAARPYGFRIMLTVSGAPDWARPAGSSLNFDGPPADYSQFANFMSALTERYAGVVGAYEIWPEANLQSRWSTAEGVSPERYTELLKQASVAIRAADPMVIIVAGSLAPTGSSDGVTVIDDLTFYQRMYDAGAAHYFDVLGARVDGYNNPPGDTVEFSSVTTTTYKGHSSFYFRHYEAVREVMAANGDSASTLWLTSAGWASSSDQLPGMEYAADVSEEQQANCLAEAMAQAHSQEYIGAIFINNFNLATAKDAPPELAPYGLIRADWSARPAFIALAQLRQGDTLSALVPVTGPTHRKHILPNWRPRLRYDFHTEQP